MVHIVLTGKKKHVKTRLSDKLSLQYDFKLQYEDPDVSNALCNLTQITDLPERASLKVIPLVTLELTTLSSSTEETDCSTADTEILSSAGSTPSLKRQWPEFFDIPNFSVDVEYRLRQADLLFMTDVPLTPSQDMKQCTVSKLILTAMTSAVLQKH